MQITKTDTEMVQDFFDKAFKKYLKDKDKAYYGAALDKIYAKFPSIIQKYMGNRLDIRSLKEFGLDILNGTEAQNEDKSRILKEASKRYGQKFAIKDNGVDNSGRLILKSTASNKNADFTLVSESGTLMLEHKACPADFKGTYKKVDLENGVRQNAVIWTTYKSFYTLIEPEAQQRMLDELEIIPRREYGFKEGVQVYIGAKNKNHPKVEKAGDFHKYGKKYEFSK